jgi:hypothetical protein
MAGASEFTPKPNPQNYLWNLSHYRIHVLPGFVTALSTEGAVTCPEPRSFFLRLVHCESGRLVPSLREGDRYL